MTQERKRIKELETLVAKLRQRVADLEDEVDRLEDEVDRLEDEVDDDECECDVDPDDPKDLLFHLELLAIRQERLRHEKLLMERYGESWSYRNIRDYWQ